MGFTVRLMLGTVLVLLCCWSIETSRLVRQTNNGESKPTDKLQKIEEEKTSQRSIVANLSEESNKPKTDISTEEKVLDKQNSIGKLQKSETYKKATSQPESKPIRDEIARSIDIQKYLSKEFHNKNNVYTLPVSSDTEKYVDHDYLFRSTTRDDRYHNTKEFHHDAELTTPKTPNFDNRYKEAVESVEQKLEHIDSSHELSSEFEDKGSLDLEKLYDETQNNDTKASLDYINYKNIINNNTADKKSVHKDLVVEAGTNLEFHSSYNETTVIDESGDDANNTIAREPLPEKIQSNTIPDQDRSESSTSKTVVLTTRKSLVLTKPPSNKNTSHISILSNNIETETVKAINLPPLETTKKPSGLQSSTPSPKLTTESAKVSARNIDDSTNSTLIDITKRGSIKYAVYAQASTEPTEVSNEIKKKTEELLQENQIVPVHVAAPTSTTTENVVRTITTEDPTSATEYLATTTEITTQATEKMTVLTTEVATEATEEVTVLTTEIATDATVLTTEISTDATVLTTEPQETTTLLPTTTTVAATTTDIVETTTESSATEPFITTSTEAAEIVSSDITTTETTILENTTISVNLYTNVTAATVGQDIPTTTELNLSTTTMQNFDENVTTTESISETSDFDKNSSLTTENAVRTSKGIVFRETVPTTEEMPVTTTVTPTTTETTERTTESTVTTGESTETKTEPNIFTTINPAILENRTKSIPEIRQEQPTSSTPETETTTENNTASSDSYELSTVPSEDNSGTIAAIAISSIGAVCLILLAGLLFVMRKRQKRFNYGQRCRPVSLDAYSMDNVSVYNSVRRKGLARSSKRSYGNPAFEDPASLSHPLNFPALGKFASNLEDIRAEFEEIPQITARTNELPEGCDTKNRYANVIPLPETRVFLTPIEGYPNSDYINANYVTGPKNVKGYYIACQAPMQNTVDDFWKMVWEQQSKVILMLTHLFENGVEKCVDYLPPSEVLDCHRPFGDYLVTLKKREVKDKYIISILQLKNMVSSSWREVTHFWYLGWPEKGVPVEANSLIAFLIEARSYMKSSSMDRKDVNSGNLTNGTAKNELNPVVVHCSPGTGRTGVVIACDIAIREFEQTRLVDVPKIVYKIRRDRASSVQTKEQYAFIYKVINLYATKLTGGALDSL